MSLFKTATRSGGRIRIAFYGASKSGKTWTSLAVMSALLKEYQKRKLPVGNGKIALIDTENESSHKYAGDFVFDSVNLSDYHPSNYIKMIREAEREGYFGLVIDQISHAWAGKGGILELVNEVQSNEKNQYTAWREPSKIHTDFIESLVSCKIHLICTMRAKVKYRVSAGAVERIGVKPIQRQTTDYEFDATASISPSHKIAFEGARFAKLDSATFNPDLKDRTAVAREIASLLFQSVEGEEVGHTSETVGLATPEQIREIEAAAGGKVNLAIKRKYLDAAGVKSAAELSEVKAQKLIDSFKSFDRPQPADPPPPGEPGESPGDEQPPEPDAHGRIKELRSLLQIPDDSWVRSLAKRGVKSVEELDPEASRSLAEALEEKWAKVNEAGEPPPAVPFTPRREAKPEPEPEDDTILDAEAAERASDRLEVNRDDPKKSTKRDAAQVIQDSIVNGTDVSVEAAKDDEPEPGPKAKRRASAAKVKK